MNWFTYQAAHRNTVRAWVNTFGITRAIAQHVQQVVTTGATLTQVNQIVSAHVELTTQTGF